MKTLTAISVAAVSLAVTIPGTAAAAEMGERFGVRGFGTLGATYHDVDDVEFRRHTGQEHGARGGELELGTDSIAGVQFDAKLGGKIDLVVQGVSRLRADGDWSLRLAQGFVRFEPDDSVVLRAGRIGYDIYLLAESRQVGYSYVPLRPSPEFYGQITNDEIDGADVSVTRRLGPGLVRARAFGGKSNGETAFADGSHSEFGAGIYGATLDYIYNGWTVRAAVVRFEYDSPADIVQLTGALRMTQFPSAVAIADDLETDVYRSKGLQLGVAYDEGPMLAQVMYGYVESDSLAGPDFDKLYALFGYRVKQWTPFASYSSSRDRHGIVDAGLPPAPMLEPLNQAVRAIQRATRSTQHTTSVGVRYDFSPNLDVKLQVDRLNVRDSSLIFDHRPGGGPVDLTVFAVALDFVF